MKKTTGLFLFIILIYSISSASDNLCRIGDVEEYANGQFSLGVYVDNSDTLAGFQLPISFEFGELDISCDSVDFSGRRCEHFDLLDSQIDNTDKVAYLMGISETSGNGNQEHLNPGAGEIARIYFTYTGTPDENTKLKLKQSKWKLSKSDLEYLFWTPDATEVRCRFKVDNIRLSF